jgi:galactokinase
VVWALTQRGAEIPGLSISLDTDLPEGAGLSSSAALGCSVTAAVNDLCDLRLDRAELVRIARQAENEFVGAPTGGMDQLASIYGEDGHALLADMRSLKVETLPLDLAAAGLSLLVTNSRISHPLADNEYRDRRASCELAARLLGVATLRELTLDDLSESLDRLDSDLLKKRVRHVVTENDRALACADLLRTGQLRQVGPLLTASHMSLRDDFDSSVPEVDLAVEVMLAFGAYGARITGRGFGGCAIALMDIAQARAAVIGLDGAFAGRGYLQPRSFTVAASSGAHALSA